MPTGIEELDIFFLGLPLPSLRMGFRLALLEELYDEREIDFSNSSFPHITVLGPRLLESETILEEVRELTGRFQPHSVSLESLDVFLPNRIVARVRGDWLHDLQKGLRELPSMPAGDSTWEGEHYNPHASIAKSFHPWQGMQEIEQSFSLPMRWVPPFLTLFVKRQGEKCFEERDQFWFRI